MRKICQPGAGHALRKLREKRGLTGREFANVTGISQGHVSELENGRKNLTPMLIERISGAWNMTVDELADAIGDAAPEEIHPQPGGDSIVREQHAPYRGQTQNDDIYMLAEWLVGKMPPDVRADTLRECTEAAIRGDVLAGKRARMMLLLMERMQRDT